MIFDKKLYYNKIKTIEDINYIKSVIITIIIILLAVLINQIIIKTNLILIILISLLIGIIISYTIYTSTQYKIEEMKMKLDIYNMIEEIKNSQK